MRIDDGYVAEVCRALGMVDDATLGHLVQALAETRIVVRDGECLVSAWCDARRETCV